MSTTTFGFASEDTAAVWRSDARADGQPFTPYYKSLDTIFLLDRRCAVPWLCLSARNPGYRRERAFALAPAPYSGALCTVLSDLLAEEGP